MAEKRNYELDTLLLKKKKLLVLDIQTGFFFRMKKKPVISTHAEKETRYIQYGQLLLFQ
jgi:hypothetical protein